VTDSVLGDAPKGAILMTLARQVAVAVVGLAVSFSASEHAGADCTQSTCQGQTRQSGGDALYNFITTTRVYRGHGVETYETCVENQSNRDMEFNWFIPGPHTFVPRGLACSNPRPQLTHKDAMTYAGCLYYGNNWTRSHASFIPHITDQPKIDAEQKDADCQTLPAVTAAEDATTTNYETAVAALKEGIETKLEVFAPSSPQSPTETMARVQAEVSLVMDSKNAGTYIHSIHIQASPFRGSKPDLSALRIVPEQNRQILSFYKEFPNGLARRLEPEIKLGAQIPLPRAPTFDTLRLTLVTPDNRPVATLFVPYIVSQDRDR
jgi:hypothetical protein